MLKLIRSISQSINIHWEGHNGECHVLQGWMCLVLCSRERHNGLYRRSFHHSCLAAVNKCYINSLVTRKWVNEMHRLTHIKLIPCISMRSHWSHPIAHPLIFLPLTNADGCIFSMLISHSTLCQKCRMWNEHRNVHPLYIPLPKVTGVKVTGTCYWWYNIHEMFQLININESKRSG